MKSGIVAYQTTIGRMRNCHKRRAAQRSFSGQFDLFAEFQMTLLQNMIHLATFWIERNEPDKF
jgi:C1A family cysteine protease